MFAKSQTKSPLELDDSGSTTEPVTEAVTSPSTSLATVSTSSETRVRVLI